MTALERAAAYDMMYDDDYEVFVEDAFDAALDAWEEKLEQDSRDRQAMEEALEMANEEYEEEIATIEDDYKEDIYDIEDNYLENYLDQIMNDEED